MTSNLTSSTFLPRTSTESTAHSPQTFTNQSSSNQSTFRNGTLSPHLSYSRSYKIVSSTLIFAIMVLAIFGNSLVVTAFRKYHKLRTVTNYFVISLAIADILISSISMPIWAAHIVTGPDPNWEKINPLGKVIWTFSDIICGLASIFNLTCISIERYICISSPLRYYQRLGSQKVQIVILCIWLFAFVLAGARVVFKDTDYIFEIMYTVVGFFIPLVIMTVMYSMIFRVACKQAKKIDIPLNGRTKKFRLRKEIKAAKTLGIVISAFFVCWSPFFVLNFLAICPTCYDFIRTDVIIAAKWFHYINSVLNPLIYARMNKEFRDAFTRILLQCAISIGVRQDSNESDLPPRDRRSSSVFSTVGRRRKSSAAGFAGVAT